MEHKINLKLMGSAFEIIVVEQDKDIAEKYLQDAIQEIRRLESALTEFSDDSFTTLINENAGIKPVQVSEEVYQLIQRAQNISSITQGAFDITVSTLKKLYNFRQQDFSFPDKKTIDSTLKTVGFQYLKLLPNHYVYLSKKQMRISFAAIGKGYAADCVKKMWLVNGVKSGAINASGDLCVFGKRADGSDWKIGIPNPDNRNEIIFSVPITYGAVATSGDYEQFFIKNGIRYSHTIHPKTGMPLKAIKSVSVFHNSAELCDALATAVYVMGTDLGLHFINQLPNTHAVIINSENKVFLSDHIKLDHAAS